MGLARELSMGPRRRRNSVAVTGDYAVLRKLTAAQAPDLDVFKAAIERVGAQPGRFRFAEGAVYIAACTRYTALTGNPIGIQQGTY